VAVVGAEGARSDLESDIFGNHTESALAAYGEGEQRLGPVRFTAAARLDYLDYIETDGGDLHAVVSPRVGAVLPRGSVVWRASVGRGFRSPSLAERYPQGSLAGLVSVIPNPNLEPETAWSFELGNTARIASAIRADVALFWTEAKRLIEPNVVVTDTSVQIQFQNLQRARLVGLDLTVNATPVPRLSTTLTYTFLHTRELAHDSVPAQPLAFRPAHLLTLRADYVRGAIGVGADFRYMSRYERVELYPPTDPLVSPKVLDLRASCQAGPLTARLLVTNALNYVYNLVPQALAPVRTLTVGASWTY
jgi:outer membrane receptor protein involved in Fe transport